MPHPVLHDDEGEREKAKGEWEREAPEIVKDLMYELFSALGRERARALFEAALKEPPYYRYETALINVMARDLYTLAEESGVPERNRITWVTDRIPGYRRAASTAAELNALRKRVARAMRYKVDKS